MARFDESLARSDSPPRARLPTVRPAEFSAPAGGSSHVESVAHHWKLARPRSRAREGSSHRRRPPRGHGAKGRATSAFGRLDVVVNNAGYANVNSIEDVAEADFRAQIETNFFGVVNVTRAALPVLRAQRDGHFIQISSVGGRLGSAGLAAYQSAKWAVGGFSEALQKEVGPLGVRVTIVEPGGMRTDWAGSSMRIDEIQPDYQATVGSVAQLRDRAVAARGDPAKAAQAILRIAADKQPPLRLLLGSDAVFLAGAIAEARAAEDANWRALSASMDFDGSVDFAQTPLAKAILARVLTAPVAAKRS
jgi:NAD(P)-dependent dehydrogenase (short-subunit alcohol dehydrogenase family)